MIKDKDLGNIAGRTGSVKGMDIKSDDFRTLQAEIISKSRKQSPEQMLKTEILAVKFDMEDYLSESNPDEVLKIGYFLRKLIDLLKSYLMITDKFFADYIGLKNTNLSAIMKGARSINFKLAYKLESVFDIPSKLWLDIQAKNEMLTEHENHNHYSLDDLMEKALA